MSAKHNFIHFSFLSKKNVKNIMTVIRNIRRGTKTSKEVAVIITPNNGGSKTIPKDALPDCIPVINVLISFPKRFGVACIIDG